MQEFINWTVDTIREDKLLAPWLEERKFDWTPLVSKSIVNILDKGCSVIVITDSDREWFLSYCLSNINHKTLHRPYLPFYDFKSFYSKLEQVKNEDDISYIKDMLNISFPNGYCFWYIGRGQDSRAIIPKISKNSFMWLFDDEQQDAFNLRSSDEALDMKLLQMFRLYNKTISATLFAQVNVEN